MGALHIDLGASLRTRGVFHSAVRLEADVPTLLGHTAARWDVEVFFGDTKDLLGLDQSQLMATTAIVRFWTLVLAAYALIDEERARMALEQQRPVTARRALQYRHLPHWIEQELHAGGDADTFYDRLTV